ncbi:probable serine/threonine-protein kinase kinX [Saccostrea echinata]|uniref:probable serine/threonine-protein kinase kinX n=1 Tax=Saccostrea echinata TaxID=191078 RepID=UPI002A810E40|nr:probable serine/threonine-protein kinase kinX [Saccostrea echinata]
MQIVDKMESNTESNMEDKIVDKEKLANDVDVNENLSKQCNGNTMSFVNRNISENENPKLNDNSHMSHENSEVELCLTEENCELHISEDSDIECESQEINKDSGKLKGENKENSDSCDHSDIGEEEIKEKDTMNNKNQTTNSPETTADVQDDNIEDRREHSSQFKCEEMDTYLEKTEEDIEELHEESANEPDNLKTPSENGKRQVDNTKKLQEDDEDNGLTLNKKDLSDERKENANVETTKESHSPDEMVRAANSTESEDRNGSSQETSDDDITTEPVDDVTDEKCEDKHLRDSVYAEEDKTLSLASTERGGPDERTFEYNEPENEEREQTVISKDSQINSENDESDVNQSKVNENVLKDNCENGSGVDSTEIVEPSAASSETSHLLDSNMYKPAATNSDDNKHNDTESAQGIQESINESKKETEIEVNMLLESENTGNRQSNAEEGDHTAECVQVNTGEDQRLGDPVDKGSCDENIQVETPASKTEPVTNTDLKSLKECDKTEHSSESAASSDMQPLGETITEVSGGNAESVSKEISKVERKLNDNDQSVQTVDKEMDTSSTQTVPKESQDQSSETNSQQVESVHTQTADYRVECEHKETDTDSLENKTEVFDKETSVSHPERTESSVQTMSESPTVNEAGDSPKKEEDPEEVNQLIEPTNLEQASQTDPQENSSLMTQTEEANQLIEPIILEKAIQADPQENISLMTQTEEANQSKEPMNVEQAIQTDLQETISLMTQTEEANRPIEPINVEQAIQTDPQEAISLMTQTEEANQLIEPLNGEQAIQTDPQETISLMTQTEDLSTEKEKALEEETGMLKDQLIEAKKMIQGLQAELVKTKAHSNYTVTTLKCQLKKSQEAQRAQQCQSDRQMGEVLAHLLFLEGQLKKDKTHIKHLLKQKDDIIQKQKLDIEDLKNTNQRLIEAVREHYSRKGKNGLSREHHDTIQGADAEVPGSPKVKEKVKNKGAFGSMKDILWKHRSSLDLSEAGMEIQGNLKKGRQYSSQENLFSLGRKNKEARENRDKKCKSIAGYPDHSLDYLIPEESELRDISLHGSNSSITKNQRSGRNVSWGSDNCDVNISYDDSGHLMATSPSQMMSAGSMPALNKNSNLELVTKDRPHSISSIESLSRENCSSIPGTPKMEEKVPHTVSQESSNPFKNLKTILKRKGSKNKNKKRTVSLSQSAKPEYEEAMKKHFEKYEMS